MDVKMFTSLDTKSGCWHVKPTDASSDLCTFKYIIREVYIYSPAVWLIIISWSTHKIRQSLKNMDGVEVHINDFKTLGKNM